MSDMSDTRSLVGVKVAVVDDAQTIRKLMQALLERMGCEVRCAPDGYKAISLLRSYRPEIIFLDINMPDFDGYKTCALIRNSAAHQTTPIIMLSSQDGVFDIAEGSVRGATGHVTKMPSEEVLRNIISRYTGRSNAA